MGIGLAPIPHFLENCYNYLPKIRDTAKGVQELAKTKTEKNQERIINIINAFKGKEVPGHIFNQEDDQFRLPSFYKVKRNKNIAVDISGHISGDKRWWVQIKIGTLFFMGDLASTISLNQVFWSFMIFVLGNYSLSSVAI